MSAINGNDFESPGYEFLRSYQNMSNLYFKLVALKYRKEFCQLYKCPPIHRYYFSFPCKNLSEQQFLFSCICAWLIKDKCHMNLEIEPEEYGESDSTIATIIEALKLLLTPEEGSAKRIETRKIIGFPPNRLKRGYGPEVIWAISILADRALEIMLDSHRGSNKVEVVYYDKGLDSDHQASDGITIGQPFVGGGLTTRPLGSYKLDDASLLFDDHDETLHKPALNLSSLNNVNKEDWYRQVERGSTALLSSNMTGFKSGTQNWAEHKQSVIKSIKTIDEFFYSSKSLLQMISNRIDRHLQVLSGREKFIQKSLEVQIQNFIEIWRDYLTEKKRQQDNIALITSKTDLFERYNDQLENIMSQIESRKRNLNDGSKTKELEQRTKLLDDECRELDIKIGLLLTVYSRKQAEVLSKNV